MTRLVCEASRTTAIAISLLFAGIHTGAFAATEAKVHPVRKVIVKVPAGVSRDTAQMRRDQEKYGTPKPPEKQLSHILMPMKKYRALKAAARSNKTRPRPPIQVPILAGRIVLDASHNFEGTQEGAGVPDTHGAASSTQYVEVTNSSIHVFDTSSGGLLFETSLASLYGSTTWIVDPRVLHDRYWDRWIVISVGYPFPGSVQPMFVAVSKTGDATGAYWAYTFGANFNQNDGALDYPELGMDQDSIIITGNRLNGTGADLIAIAKAGLYNGLEFEIADFQGLAVTLAPPVVLDQNPTTFLIAATPENSVLSLYALTNSSRPISARVSGPIEVPVVSYRVPPDVLQPSMCGTDPTSVLETLDARFENASTQTGRFLYQTHTVNIGGLATPIFYKIDTVANRVLDTGAFFADAMSNDFNASIAADAVGNVYVTWTSIDLSLNRNADVRFAGKRGAAPTGGLGNGAPVFTSSTCLTGAVDPNFGHRRWGDYSSVVIDPQGGAWFINEKIIPSGRWGSHIGRMVWKQVIP